MKKDRPPESLAEMIDVVVADATNFYAKSGTAEWMTVAWMQKEDGQMALLHLPWRSDNEKHVMIGALAETLRQNGVIRYALAVEAWIAEEDPKKPSGIMPRNNPDRKEVLMISSQEKGGNGKTTLLMLTREKNRTLVARDDMEGGMGWMANLLGEPGRPN